MWAALTSHTERMINTPLSLPTGTVTRELGQHVAILQDLCGPKIRLGSLKGDVLQCPLGEEFTLVAAVLKRDA